MKAKEKKEVLSALCDDINPHDEAVFAIYTTKKKGDYYVKGNMELIANGIRNILNEGIAGEEGEPATVVAWTILSALRDIQDQGVSIDELLTAFDDDDEDEDVTEDCEHCDMNRVCQAPEAIEYRKANGIQRPKKVKKIKIEVN